MSSEPSRWTSSPSPAPISALGALGVYMLGNYHRGGAITTPLTRQLRVVGHSTMLPLALVAVGVGFFNLHPVTIRQSFVAVGAAALTSLACRATRWRLQAPVRVVVVGDRAAVATATARWARTPQFHVVGGLLMEPDLSPNAAPPGSSGRADRHGARQRRDARAAVAS